METLLSLAFDNLSSPDLGKIRKGLRQLEGLFAQICLAQAQTRETQPDTSSWTSGKQDEENRPRGLEILSQDLAFAAFYHSQEGFQWNVAMRLVGCLERLLGKGSNGKVDLLIISTLDLLHGILLMHPPSRILFAQEIHMNLLLDLLEPDSCPAIHVSTLLVLVTALLANPSNTRTFETLDGLLTITSLFKSRTTSREAKLKAVEFLYFYLMPERPHSASEDDLYEIDTRTSQHSAQSKHSLQSASSAKTTDSMPSLVESTGSSMSTTSNLTQIRRGGSGKRHAIQLEATLSIEQKQSLLGRFMSNVDDLVNDLREQGAYGIEVAV